MLRQKIGEVERAWLIVMQFIEQFASGKKLVTVRTRNALHPRIIDEHCVDHPARATVGITNKSLTRFAFVEVFAKCRNNSFWTVMQVGR